MAGRQEGERKFAFVIRSENLCKVLCAKQAGAAQQVFQKEAVLAPVAAEVKDRDGGKKRSFEVVKASRLEVEIHIGVFEP